MIVNKLNKQLVKLGYCSQLASTENKEFQKLFDKYIGKPFKNKEQIEKEKYFAFKAKYNKVFADREEKGIFAPGEIGPHKKEKVDMIL